VMILVEAHWIDPAGSLRTATARMENKSSLGACIRIRTQVEVGTRLSIIARREQFSGIARYCRREGCDYLIGVQKDTVPIPIVNPLIAAAGVSPPLSTLAVSSPVLSSDPGQQGRNRPALLVLRPQQLEPERVANGAVLALTSSKGPAEVSGVSTVQVERMNSPVPLDLARPEDRARQQPIPKLTAHKGRNTMRRKWMELVHRQSKANDLDVTEAKIASQQGSSGVTATQERAQGLQVELLPPDDIYRSAGIMNPPKGYTVHKLIEMTQSDHVRSLSKEMKRAAVLMALEAANVSIQEVRQDAQSRLDVLNAYESGQRKLLEVEWAQIADENNRIQAELERVKAQYAARIARNLDGMAREKAAFSSWLGMKQQELQAISEAVDLCLKPNSDETSILISHASAAATSSKA